MIEIEAVDAGVCTCLRRARGRVTIGAGAAERRILLCEACLRELHEKLRECL